ncbi:actin-related protein RO7 [Mariannaea sp. PMI_226]|nr:actin-related protein RO7 [Mariannaea sp. PMI_226]
MASTTGPTLAHRSVASIRSAPTPGTPSTPHTPSRSSIAQSYGSPSTIRADDEVVLIQIGSRYIRAGLAGDSQPKAVLQCGPDDQRRAGDYRGWQGETESAGLYWSADHEFWRYDMRTAEETGLFQDKLDRALRDAFTRFLLIDSRPRKIGLVLDSAVPVPLLTATLDALFSRFQSPSVSLMSIPVMSAVAAGVRSALVIDMGWSETIVTSVYEYREVKSTRTVRAGRMLLDALYKVINAQLRGTVNVDDDRRVITFAECEDILRRLMWCRPSASRSSQRQSKQLETVEEQDETEVEASHAANVPIGTAHVPIDSTNPPTTLEISFEKLAEICEDTFFDPSKPYSEFDDEEIPAHLLVYRHLLQLPLDVRAICMSRIIFTGGCSNILGIKERIIDDVVTTVEKRQWTPVAGKSVDQFRNNPKLPRRQTDQSSKDGPASPPKSEEEKGNETKRAADRPHEYDAIEAKVARQRDTTPKMHGQFRVLHSLGPWTGGSLLCHLKVPAMVIIDRDIWLQQGVNGASRPSDVDVKAQQRHSTNTGRGGGGHHSNWTLGTWGYM